MSKEQESVYLSKIILKDYKSFKGENEFDLLDENGNWVQWNILLGNNNVGKTNYLKAIASIQGAGQINMAYPNKKALLNERNLTSRVNLVYDSSLKIRNYIKFYISPEQRWVVKKGDKIPRNLDVLTGSIFGYGVTRRYESNQGISNSSNRKSITLFDYNATLQNIEEWLFQLDYASKNGNQKATKRLKKIKELFISDLFPEIIDYKFITADNSTLDNYIEFQTKDGWFRLNELGYGYQSSMSWLVDFSKGMFERYPDSENPLTEPAIVLIDEIDLHLHPSWQKNVIGFLSKTFPKTQFIVTTHSPIIIQSFNKLNLFVLFKEGSATEHKKFTNHTFKGWSIEEILEEVMQIENGGYSDTHQQLYKAFDKALDDNSLKEAKAVYQKLDEILHPESEERKLLKLQLSQIVEVDD